MILGFDIGNTDTVMGIFDEDEIVPRKRYRYKTNREETADGLYAEVHSFLRIYSEEAGLESEVSGIVFSSVVPEVNERYALLSDTLCKCEPIAVSALVNLSIQIRYDIPSQLGADRIANAEASFQEYGRDCIIVDLGTATTFCVLHESGIYDGGLIGPGIQVAMDALSNKTSRLLKVEFAKPESMIAHNTAEAITSGFFYGWLSMVEGIIKRIEEQYKKDFLKIITGGFSEIVGKNIECKNVIDRDLTMKGLKYIYDLNVLK